MMIPVTEMTDAQRLVWNRWCRWGAECFVTKMGRKWWVELNGSMTPTPFKTKREAVAHADARVAMFLRRDA